MDNWKIKRCCACLRILNTYFLHRLHVSAWFCHSLTNGIEAKKGETTATVAVAEAMVVATIAIRTTTTTSRRKALKMNLYKRITWWTWMWRAVAADAAALSELYRRERRAQRTAMNYNQIKTCCKTNIRTTNKRTLSMYVCVSESVNCMTC